MILISHRGNINGKCTEKENNPSYILTAISEGFDVEVDVWFIKNNWFLGHDRPEFEIDFEWLDQKSGLLWVHCKNTAAVEEFKRLEIEKDYRSINYFFHNKDDITLTSHGFIWKFPGISHINNSINVMPEIHNEDVKNCAGVCSDYIFKYKSTENGYEFNK